MRHIFFLFVMALTLSDCGPKVISFNASPATMITRDDSVKFSWKVRGKSIILFYTEDADDPLNPGAMLLQYKLVAQKHGKEAFLPQTLKLLPDTVADSITVKTLRQGNILFGIDTLAMATWGTYFKLDQVYSSMGRPLTVTHGGKSIELTANGSMSAGFKGIPNSGPWEIRTPMTQAELADSTRIPGHLITQTKVIHHKD